MRLTVAHTSAAATRGPVGPVGPVIPIGRVMPIGRGTRGTTAPRRLRRVDRWLVAAHPRLLATPALLVVDLGFGARPFTTLELSARLRRTNPGARVVGLEIGLGRWRRGELTVKWDAVRPIGR